MYLDNNFHFFLSANWLQLFIMQAEDLAVFFSPSCGILFSVSHGGVFVLFVFFSFALYQGPQYL